jgi:hypothetical protein
MAGTLKAFLERSLIDADARKEQESLRWLLERFFPENPGSRFVSVTDLKKMAPTSLDSGVTRQRLQEAAANLLSEYAHTQPYAPGFVPGNDEYFSLSDMFELLSGALAQFSRTGSLPDTVQLTNVYGPLEVTPETGINEGEFSVESISRAAAGLWDTLRNQTWAPVPANTVPTWVTVDGSRVNAIQFLILMAESCLDPTPGKKMKVERSVMISRVAAAYPRRIFMEDLGNAWTVKPAVLRLRVPPPVPHPAPR